MEKIFKTELVSNLERAIHCDVGWRGLQILIYGWLNYHKYGRRYRHAVQARDYLFITEVQSFSEYAGYDLSKSHYDDKSEVVNLAVS